MRLPLILSFCFLTIASYTQDDTFQLYEISKKTYSDGQKEGKLESFEPLFRSEPSIYHSYVKYQHNRKSQKILNYVGAGVLGITLINTANRSDDVFQNNIPPGYYFTALLGIIGNGISGSLKNKHKRALLDHRFSRSGLVNGSSLDLDFLGDFRQISNHKFGYEGQWGKLHDFGFLFEKDPQLYETFLLFNKSRRHQRTGNVVAGSVGGVFVILGVVVASEGGDWSGLIGAAVGVSGVLTGGAIATITNLINGPRKNKYREYLLSRIDSDPVGYRTKRSLQLNLAGTSNGVGIVLSF